MLRRPKAGGGGDFGAATGFGADTGFGAATSATSGVDGVDGAVVVGNNAVGTGVAEVADVAVTGAVFIVGVQDPLLESGDS